MTAICSSCTRPRRKMWMNFWRRSRSRTEESNRYRRVPMLPLIEKILFTLLALGSAYTAYVAADRIIRIVRRGTGAVGLDELLRRAVNAGIVFVTQRTGLQ